MVCLSSIRDSASENDSYANQKPIYQTTATTTAEHDDDDEKISNMNCCKTDFIDTFQAP